MVALTKTQAIAKVQQGLGFRTDLSTEIELELRLQQAQLEQGQTLPWFLRVTGTLTGTANVATLSLPTGFIRFDPEGGMFFDSTPDDSVSVVDYDDLLRVGWDTSDEAADTGTARWIAFSDTGLIVRPIPTAAFTIAARWYAHDTDLDDIADDASNDWLTYAPLVLVGKTGLEMSMDTRDVDAQKRFQAMYADAQARLVSDIALREDRLWQVGSAL